MNRMVLLAAFLISLLMGGSAWAQTPPSPTARGEYLARAGDCVACHSTPGGKAFAGGLKMGTPLGAIYATNITPDIETGIGTYTEQEFDRAVRRGVAKDGRRLYPAMPYPSYAKLSDDDVQVLYEYFMRAVPPAHQVNQPSEIPTLLKPRWPMAVWNAVFVGGGNGFTSDPQHDAAWNRGAYLVEGPGHCGACHTARGIAYEEKALDRSSLAFLAGANLDGWYAPSLRQNRATGLGGWSKEDIVAFLKTGHNKHGSAYGSMRDVINNSTPYLTDEDLNDIAVYLTSLPATVEEKAPVYDDATATALAEGSSDPGAAVYAGQCQSCHKETGGAAPPFLPALAGNPTVLDRDASSLINIVLNGSAPLMAKGAPSPYRMPQYRAQLSNQQVAEVVSFIRSGWGNNAPRVSAGDVATLRKSTDPASDQPVILRMR